MTSAERMCIVAARSEGLLVDFVVLFLLRWGLKLLGLDYLNFQPVLDQVSPPFVLADFVHPASALFNASMYFASGMPELILAGLWIVYAILAISIFGQTLGMRQAGTRLVDRKGAKPAFWRVVIRQLFVPVSAICWIGFIPAGFTDGASTVHDLISGTRVVFAEKKESASVL